MRTHVVIGWVVVAAVVGGVVSWTGLAQPTPNPRQQPGAQLHIYAPER